MRPIDIASADLETVRCILREYAPGLEVRAFGSRVSFTARETSDLDLALMTEEPLSIARMTSLKAAFTKSYLPFRVDIVDWSSASENFRKVIEREHVVLVERNSASKFRASKTKHLGDCVTINDSTYSPKEEYPFINYLDTGNITNNRISEIRFLHVGSDVVPSRARRKVQPGDIVYSTVRPIQRHYGLLKEVPENFLVSTGFCVIRGNPRIAETDFIYWFLTQNSVIEQLNTIAEQSTSAYPSIKPTDIEKLGIELPPLTEQRAIAHILGTLDDKIELNRRMNKTLEEMAQALFKSWFVDFEPVKAKLAVLDKGGTAEEAERAAMCTISGKDEFALSKLEKEQPEAFSNLAQTASQFPSTMQNSELGGIPKGWEIVPFQSAVIFKEGPGIRNWQYTNSDQGTHFINIRCIQNGDLDLKTANRITDQEANGRYSHFHLQEWDIVVSTSGTLGRNAIVRKEHLPLVLNTSVIRFRPKQFRITFGYLYGYLNSNEFLTKLESMASGSVQKNFGPMHLNQLSILCPTINCIEYYEKITLPLFRMLIENRRANETLAHLLELMLPNLISGQIRVAR